MKHKVGIFIHIRLHAKHILLIGQNIYEKDDHAVILHYKFKQVEVLRLDGAAAVKTGKAVRIGRLLAVRQVSEERVLLGLVRDPAFLQIVGDGADGRGGIGPPAQIFIKGGECTGIQVDIKNARHIFAESQQLKYTGCVFEFRDGRPFREQILETIRPGIRSIYEEAGEPGSRFRRVHLSAVKLEAVDFSFGNQPEKRKRHSAGGLGDLLPLLPGHHFEIALVQVPLQFCFHIGAAELERFLESVVLSGVQR